MPKTILLSVLICLFICQMATAQQWTKTAVKDIATIDFPVPVKIVDTLGNYILVGHSDSASFLVAVRKVPNGSGSELLEIMKSLVNGKLEADKANMTQQTEFTINGSKGLETWYVASNTIKGGRIMRYMRVVYTQGYAVLYEIHTFPELEKDQAIAAARDHFFNSFQLLAAPQASSAVPIVSDNESILDDSVGGIAHKIGYLIGRLLLVGLIVAAVIFLIRKLRR